MQPSSGGVFVALPTLNEERNIVALLERIEGSLRGERYTLCLIDDGSRDATVSLFEKFTRDRGIATHVIQRVKKHWGCQRGSAIRAGLEWGLRNTAYDVFIEMDADLSHRPEEFAEGIRIVRQLDFNVAIASKYVSGSQVLNRPFGRRLLSIVCNAMVRTWLFFPAVSDFSNGFRFYDRASLEAMFSVGFRYGSPIYLSEALTLLLARGARVREFPSTYVGRAEGLSKVRIVDLVKAGIAVQHIAAKYHGSRLLTLIGKGPARLPSRAPVRLPVIPNRAVELATF